MVLTPTVKESKCIGWGKCFASCLREAHPDINATRIIDYTYEMGMGNKEYELIKF